MNQGRSCHVPHACWQPHHPMLAVHPLTVHRATAQSDAAQAPTNTRGGLQSHRWRPLLVGGRPESARLGPCDADVSMRMRPLVRMQLCRETRWDMSDSLCRIYSTYTHAAILYLKQNQIKSNARFLSITGVLKCTGSAQIPIRVTYKILSTK